jgi:hypothetical protein
MTLRDDLLTTLTGDSELFDLLPGGIYTGTEISRQTTPSAFDSNGEIRPCALLRIESQSPVGPYANSARTYVLVFVYQFKGYDVIDPALDRIFALLDRKKVGDSTWEVRHADDVRDVEDQGLMCSMAYSRYVITRMR